jgi:hypothetical protein
VIVSKGGSRQEPGVVSFRKHIDALSPEARREVMDRVRPPSDGNANGMDPTDDIEDTGDSDDTGGTQGTKD